MRIAMFVDGNNLNGTMRNLGWRIDYKKLLDFVARSGQVVEAHFFASYRNVEQYGAFIDMLSHTGYACAIKTSSVNKEGITNKGNCDIEMASSIILSMPLYDKAVLVTGDSDFGHIVNILRSHGKACDVISHPANASRHFRAMLGMHFINIEDYKDVFQRTIFGSDYDDADD